MMAILATNKNRSWCRHVNSGHTYMRLWVANLAFLRSFHGTRFFESRFPNPIFRIPFSESRFLNPVFIIPFLNPVFSNPVFFESRFFESRFFESRFPNPTVRASPNPTVQAESRFPNPSVRASSAGGLKCGTVASRTDRQTHWVNLYRRLVGARGWRPLWSPPWVPVNFGHCFLFFIALPRPYLALPIPCPCPSFTLAPALFRIFLLVPGSGGGSYTGNGQCFFFLLVLGTGGGSYTGNGQCFFFPFGARDRRRKLQRERVVFVFSFCC